MFEISILKRTIQKSSAGQGTYVRLISLLYQNAELKEAETLSNEALEQFGTQEQLTTLLGDAILGQGNCDDAIVAYERGAAEADPFDDSSWINLVLGLWRCGKRDKARQVSDRILKLGQIPAKGHPVDSREAVEYLLPGCQGIHCASYRALKTKGEKWIDDARGTAAFAHSNYAEYSWLKKEYAKANEHSLLSQELDGFWEQWPFYCSRWNIFFGDGPQQAVTKKDKLFVKSWSGEATALKKVNGVGIPELTSVIKDLRQYECSDEFVNMELENFYKPLDFKTAIVKGAAYSPQNYQYGTFFYDGFVALFDHDLIKPHVDAAIKNNHLYLMLGGNVGNEAFYGALTYGLRTLSIEIMCNLVDKAKLVQEKYASKFDLEFACMDCLTANISEAMIVYMDNEIWDNFLTTEIYRKMGKELPVGAIVIGWKRNVHQQSHGWKDLGSIAVPTSWSDDPQDVFVLQRTDTAVETTPEVPFTEKDEDEWFKDVMDTTPAKDTIELFSYTEENNDLCQEGLSHANCSEVTDGSSVAHLVDTGGSYGMVTHLGCEPVRASGDSFIAYEVLAHAALANLATAPTDVLVLGGADGGVLKEILKYKTVKQVVVHHENKAFMDLAAAKLPFWGSSLESDKVILKGDSLLPLPETGQEASYDAIILDFPEANKASYKYINNEVFEALLRLLRPGGALSFMLPESFCSNDEKNHQCKAIPSIYKNLQKSFQSVWVGGVPNNLFQQFDALFVAFSSSGPEGHQKTQMSLSPEDLDSALSQKLVGDRLKFYSGATHEQTFMLPEVYQRYLDRFTADRLTHASMMQFFQLSYTKRYSTGWQKCACNQVNCSKDSEDEARDEL